MYSKEDIDKVKRISNIVDIANEHLKLKKSGRSYFALCPFHNEKTPSFSINEDLQFYYCFGCGETGDIIKLIEKLENLDFTEALESLAKRYSINISKKSGHSVSAKSNIFQLNLEAVSFFQQKLKESKIALKYLKSRNISDESIKSFKIGYDPEGNSLSKYLISKGYSNEVLIKYGLSKENRGIQDKFRNRIIFPIQNIKGEILGFTSRAILSDTIPKYLNSPETEIFHKNEILYGINLAKEAIITSDYVIITEGNIDVITAYQNGIKNIVGIQGTAISLSHLNTLKRYTKNIYVAFDSDNAGYKAFQKSADLAHKSDFNLKVLDIKGAKDIDESINKYGVKEFHNVMVNVKDYISYTIEKETENISTKNYESKIKAAEKVMPVINQISNPIKRSYFISELSKAIDIPFEAINKVQNSIQQVKKTDNNSIQKQNRTNTNEFYFLYLILQSERLSKIGLNSIKEEYLQDSIARRIYVHLIKHNFKKDIDKISIEIYKRINIESIQSEKQDEIEKQTKEILSVIKLIKNAYIRKEIKTLKGDISKSKDKEEILKKVEKLASEYIQ